MCENGGFSLSGSHFCNPSSRYGKYGKFPRKLTRKMCTKNLDTLKPYFNNVELVL